MRVPNELTRSELLQIVESIQQILYLDLDDQGCQYWNPDKSWNGADVCDSIVQSLAEYDLVPDEPQPFAS